MCVQVPVGARKGHQISVSGATGSCELPSVSAGTVGEQPVLLSAETQSGSRLASWVWQFSVHLSLPLGWQV